MGRPTSKMKINRQGQVTFESNVDAVNYTIRELTRAALYDTAKFIRKAVIKKLKTLHGMKKHKRPYSTQYWIRKIETDLQIGFAHDAWYTVGQEIGDKNMQKHGYLRDTVYENIDQIQQIQAQYLSALNDKNPSDPGDQEYKSPEGEE